MQSRVRSWNEDSTKPTEHKPLTGIRKALLSERGRPRPPPSNISPDRCGRALTQKTFGVFVRASVRWAAGDGRAPTEELRVSGWLASVGR